MPDGWWLVSYAVLWGLVLVLSVVMVALARQIGTLHMRLGPRGALEIGDEGPALGEAPEPETLADLTGSEIVIGGPGTAQLLLFVSPGCKVCEQILPSVRVVGTKGDLSPIVLTDLDQAETRLAYSGKQVAAPVVPATFLAQRYAVPGTPYVVVLDRQGVVRAKGTVNNLEQLEGLIETGKRRSAQALTDRQAS